MKVQIKSTGIWLRVLRAWGSFFQPYPQTTPPTYYERDDFWIVDEED